MRVLALSGMALAFVSMACPAAAGSGTTPGSAAGIKQQQSHPLADLRLEDLSVTRDRPLFSPSRRPPPRFETPPISPTLAALETKTEAPAPPPFDLVGAVIGGDVRYVLLRSHATQEVARLGQGDEKDGWTVSAVNRRSVELELGGRVERLDFGALSAPAPPPTSQLAGLNPRPDQIDSTLAADPADAPPIAEAKRLKRKFNLR